MLVLFAQGISVQGVSVLGGKCPGGKCPGGICPRGYMSLVGKCLSCHHNAHLGSPGLYDKDVSLDSGC